MVKNKVIDSVIELHININLNEDFLDFLSADDLKKIINKEDLGNFPGIKFNDTVSSYSMNINYENMKNSVTSLFIHCSDVKVLEEDDIINIVKEVYPVYKKFLEKFGEINFIKVAMYSVFYSVHELDIFFKYSSDPISNKEYGEVIEYSKVSNKKHTHYGKIVSKKTWGMKSPLIYESDNKYKIMK